LGETLYGRESIIEELIDLIISSRVVLLYSPSGAGKTSLIQAGIIPRLIEEDFKVFPVMRVGYEPPAFDTMMQEEDPAKNKDDIARICYLEEPETTISPPNDPRSSSPSPSSPPALQKQKQGRDKLKAQDFFSPTPRRSRRTGTALSGILRSLEEGVPAVNRYIFSLLVSLEAGRPPEERLPLKQLASMSLEEYLSAYPRAEDEPDSDVLIFDQFEEIMTVDPVRQAARFEFFSQLGKALHNRNRWSIFCMREDYFASLDSYMRWIPTRFKHTFRLTMLDERAALKAVQKPAHAAGVEFTDAAARHLINDLRYMQVQKPDGSFESVQGPYIEPVQLQVVCYRLWQELPASITSIEQSHIVGSGNVNMALAGYYSDGVQKVASVTGVNERTIREWFDRQLITEYGTRGQVLQTVHKSQGLDNHAIEMLLGMHLVRAERRHGMTWFELAHDRLLLPVRSNNAAWFEQHLNNLQVQADIWERVGRPEAMLLRDDSLIEAQEWAEAHADQLTKGEEEFLRASQQARIVDERERQANRRIRSLAIGAVAVSVVALVMLFVTVYSFRQAYQREQDAIRQTRMATVHGLSSAALGNLERDPELSVVQAFEAVSLSTSGGEPVVPEAFDALQQAVHASHVRLTLDGHVYQAYAVAFSPDGSSIATSSADGMIKVWDAGTGEETHTLIGHDSRVYALAFHPDGTRLVTASLNRVVKVWDVAQGIELRTLYGYQSPIYAAAFSADGAWLATGHDDGSVRVRDLETGRDIHTVVAHSAAVQVVAFSPQGDSLVTASLDGQVKLLDVVSWEEQVSLTHDEAVLAVAFGPDGQQVATASGTTAYVWDVASGTTVQQFEGHGTLVRSLAFHPQATRLATASMDGTVQVWERESGKSLFSFDAHTDSIWSVVFDPQGNYIATASADGTVRVWDATSGNNHFTLLNQYPAALTSVDVGLDGTLVATAGKDGMVKLWDAETGEQVAVFRFHQAVTAVWLSTDGTSLAVGTADGTVRLWDVVLSNEGMLERDSGSERLRLDGHARAVTDMKVHPDGLYLATASADGSVRLWNMTDGHEIDHLSRHVQRVNEVCFSPDGSLLATASSDGKVMVWDVQGVGDGERSKVIETLDDFGGAVYHLDFSPDGSQLLATSDSGTLHMWDVIAEPGTEQITLMGDIPFMGDVAFSPQGDRIAVARSDGVVEIVDSYSGKLLLLLAGQTGTVESLKFTPDGSRLVTSAIDGNARIWDVTTGHTDSVNQVAFAPGGEYAATASSDGTVRLWKVGSEPQSQALWQHEDRVNDVAFSPNGRLLASCGDDGKVQLWDITLRQNVYTIEPFEAHKERVSTIAFAPNGTRFAIGSSNGAVQVWDVAMGRLVQILAGHRDQVNDMAFSPDGSLLVTVGADRQIKLWNSQTAQEVHTIGGHFHSITSVTFHPDGTQLVTTDEQQADNITVWDVESGKLVQTLEGHTNLVSEAVFSPDGTRLATASWDFTARVWDVASGEVVVTLNHPAAVESVAFGPDGDTLATASGHRMWLYPLDVDELMQVARTRVTRSFSNNVCRKVLYGRNCPFNSKGGSKE
jgi:WD40 repeat protein